MKKIRIFIDYPVSDDHKFKGLSFPQVLNDYLKVQDEVELVGEADPFDILLVISGGSHYTHLNTVSLIEKIRDSVSKGLHFLGADSIHYRRQLKRNVYYEKRITHLLSKNPKAKLVHRLDDRYRHLCKVYGYDETVKWINNRAYATVCQTEYGKSLYTSGVKSIFGMEPPMQVENDTIIFNGVDREVFNDKGPKVSLEGKYKILHVATTGMPRKGLGKVLEFAWLLRNNPEIQFYLIGRQIDDPVYGYEIKKFSNVHYVGQIEDRHELASYYRGGDVLLFPTIEDCSPNVVLEAMSCGLPVVAANSGGTPELILKEDVHGGILINERNPLYALKEVLAHLDLFSERAIDLVKKYHDKEVMGRNYLLLFKSLFN